MSLGSSGINNALIAELQIAATDASARIQAATASANAQAQAEIQAATIRADADKAVAETDLQSHTQTAQIAGQYQLQAAQVDAGWHGDVARTEADAQTTSAETAAGAQRDVASTNAQAQTTSSQTAADAQRDVANIDASWRQEVATTEANAQRDVASTNAQAQTSVASTESQWRNSVASTESGWRNSVASTEAQAQTTSASTQADAQKSVADTQAQAQTTSASTQANAQIASANIDASWRNSVATITANAQVQSASIDAGWHSGVATTEASASNYKADQDLAGVNAHEAAETARLNLKLAFAEDKWLTLLPDVQAAFGVVTGSGSGGGLGFHASGRPGPTMGFGGSGADDFQVGTYSRRVYSGPIPGPIRMGAGDAKTGGIGFATGATVADAVAATRLPFINTSGVLTPSQIQQQVNAAYARADAKTNSAALALIEEMSGRGFSAASPILAALRVGLTGQSIRSGVLAEQQIRLEGAKANAEQVLNSQKTASDQFLEQERVLVESAKNDVTRTVGVLSAVAQLIGSAL